METENLKNIFEAVVFACGEPIEIERIAEAMEISVKEVEDLGNLLSEEYDRKKSGFKLIKLDNKYQMCSRPEYFNYVRAILEIKRNTPLSQAAFEVISVIAYNQPVTKSVIEQVRGVDCTGVISSLCEKGLIEEKGRLDLPGRPLLYGTTDDFLRCFSLNSISDLPLIPQKQEDEVPESESTESIVN